MKGSKNIDIIETLKKLKPELKKNFGINNIGIFGSYSRGEESEKSDIDIIIIDMDRKNGFIIAKAKRFLSERLKKEVDIGLLDSIRPFIRKRIEKEIIYV